MTQHTWLNDPYLALGAQVRLRRNVDGLPFGPRLQEAQALGLLHRAEDASKRASGAGGVISYMLIRQRSETGLSP